MSFSGVPMYGRLLVPCFLITEYENSLQFKGSIVQPLTGHLSGVVIRSLPGAWPVAGQARLGFPHVLAWLRPALAILIMRLTRFLDIAYKKT